MSEEDRLRAHTWRSRAEELRTVADGFSDWRARDDLLRIAEQWEVMARRLESRIPLDLSKASASHVAEHHR